MIVIDASAVLEVLFPSDDADAGRRRILNERLHAPHLLDLEVAQVIRRYLHREQITRKAADDAFSAYGSLRIRRHGHRGLLPRAWSLRDNLTVYDAAYVALAEALDVPLLTRDRGLAAAPGHRARVELI